MQGKDVSKSESGSAAALAPPGLRFVTARAMAIACALMPLLALWVVQSELIWYSGHPTAISLFYHVTFAIFVIALINLWVLKRWPARALSSGELMTIYMMLAVASTFCSHDLLQVFIPMVSYPEYAANPMNRYDELILPYLKPWSYLTNLDAETGLAIGNASLYKMSILKAWAKPLGFWFAFLMALMGALVAINIFFRQHWTERERLSFPVIQIPMVLATGLGGLLRNRLFWIAFGITAAIDLLNGFNFFFPNLPHVPIVNAFSFFDYLVERPWDSIRLTSINLYPFVIGLTFFMPTDLAFSCWFFFIIFKLQLVVTSAVGVRDLPGFPFPVEQSAGGYIGLGLLAIWLSRRHFYAVVRRILGLPGGADQTREPISYRAALLLFIASTASLLAMGKALGGTLPVLIVFFIIFFLYSIAIARMRAELGPPAHDLHAAGPDMLLHHAFGARDLDKGDLTVFTQFFWFNRAYRAHFSAHSIEGFKLAQLTGITARSMLKAMTLAVVLGSMVALWALLHVLYVHGYSGRHAGETFSQEAWLRMAGWTSFPQEANLPAATAAGLGALVVLILGALRMKYTWWLWHPVGYATCTTWSMEKLWFCIFLGWLAKTLITRYGGASMYRKAMPFFIGLVMGEFTVGSLWGIYGSIVGAPVYHFWG